MNVKLRHQSAAARNFSCVGTLNPVTDEARIASAKDNMASIKEPAIMTASRINKLRVDRTKPMRLSVDRINFERHAPSA